MKVVSADVCEVACCVVWVGRGRGMRMWRWRYGGRNEVCGSGLCGDGMWIEGVLMKREVE